MPGADVHAVYGGVAASINRRITPYPVTLCRAAVRWLETYVATARNPKGQRLAEVRFHRYLLPWFGRTVLLQELTGDDVRQYRLGLEQKLLLSPCTAMHVLSDFRCLLRWAVSIGLLERSPFPPRVMPKIPEVPPRRLDNLEIEVLTSFEGRMGFVLRFLLGTGLRWGEACRARREHVRGTMLEVSHTKSGRMRRVPLSPALLEEIRGYEGQLVPYAAGSPGSFSRTVRRITEFEDFHVHRCRHTFAMLWMEAGGNLAVLQQILGHRDLSTTMRYARVTDELIEREAVRIAPRRQAILQEDDY